MKFLKSVSLLVAALLLFTGCAGNEKTQNATEVANKTTEIVSESVQETEEEIEDSAQESTVELKKNLPAWKIAYYEYLQAQEEFDLGEYSHYCLLYIDDDEIPEVLLMGMDFIILTQNSNGEVDMCIFGRIACSICRYEPGSGKFFEDFMRRDSGSLTLYEISNGTISATEVGGGRAFEIGLDEFEDDFYVEGEKVTWDEYHKSWTQYLDEEKTIKIVDTENYEKIDKDVHENLMKEFTE